MDNFGKIYPKSELRIIRFEMQCRSKTPSDMLDILSLFFSIKNLFFSIKKYVGFPEICSGAALVAATTNGGNTRAN